MARSSLASKPKKAAAKAAKAAPVAAAAVDAKKQKSAGKAKAVPPPPAPVAADEDDDEAWVDEDSEGDDDDEEEEDSEDEGVDEEGMARLMKLLGDDGLDEMGRAQLEALASGESDEEDGSDEENEKVGSDEDDAEALSSGDEEEGSADEDEEEDEDAEMDEDEDEEGVPLDELDSVDEDAVPRQKVEIDDTVALSQIRDTIKLDSSLPWTETLVLSYPKTIDVDVDDDLNRELAFYKQALHGAEEARARAAKANFPFTRPSDYFAEMIKSDAHMERIRIRLLDETATIKKSELKRKEREGKKFGKQVQVEKLKERERSKKEMEERLKGLKRKRKDVLDGPTGGDDDFDIQVEDAISDRPAKRGRATNGRGIPRDARDKKYGFGGATRHSKSNTRESTDDFGPGAGRGKPGRGGFRGRGGRGGGRGGSSGGRGGFGGGRGGSSGGRGGSSGGRGGRGGAKRLGKSRRAATK